VDRLLRTLVTRALRRGVAGEPIWLAVAVGAWLIRRGRNAGPEVIWKGRVSPGQRLTVTTTDPAPPGGPDPG
jgi:hypothetical protein